LKTSKGQLKDVIDILLQLQIHQCLYLEALINTKKDLMTFMNLCLKLKHGQELLQLEFHQVQEHFINA
jgi:hypothetical protein